MLGTANRQPVHGVVMDHRGDRVEGLGELAKDELLGRNIIVIICRSGS